MDDYLSLADEDFAKASFMGKTLFKNNYVDVTKYSVETDEQARETGRRKGDYYTVYYDRRRLGMKRQDEEIKKRIVDVLVDACDLTRPLAIGLGNQKITSDSLGCETVDKLAEMKTRAMLFKPWVYGACKIESADSVKGIVSVTAPTVILAIDALGCLGIDKLFSSFQLSTSGITPGEAVGNARVRLDRAFLGVPVVSIGVPLISVNPSEEVCVTPKDVDVVVDHTAKILSSAIATAIDKKVFRV